jgi:hypothetical protein
MITLVLYKNKVFIPKKHGNAYMMDFKRLKHSFEVWKQKKITGGQI